MNSRDFVWSTQGYTSFKRHSYESRVDDLARLDSRLRNVHPFRPAFEHLQAYTDEARNRLQRTLLNDTEHGFPYSIRLAALSPDDATWVRDEVRNAYLAFLSFVRVRGSKSPVGGKSVAGFLEYLRDQPSRIYEKFVSFLKTSALDYSRDCAIGGADDIFDRVPLFAESGADVMMGPEGPMFAEFNSVTGSYPHALELLRQSHASVLPELFADLKVVSDTFREPLNKSPNLWSD
jgi:hypothetical protein